MRFNATGIIFVVGLCSAVYLTFGLIPAAWTFVGWCAFSVLAGIFL